MATISGCVRGLAALIAFAIAGCGAPAPSGMPGPPAPLASVVTMAITEDGLRHQLDDLGAVAGESVGFRALGSPGYDAAASLVAGKLASAGWTVSEDRFTAPGFTDDGGSSLVLAGRTFAAGEVRPLVYAPGGSVTGPVVAIDWDPGATGPGPLGCAAADYGSLPPGAIVLVRSSQCYRRVEVLAAQEAGAAAFVAVVMGVAPDSTLRPTLVSPDGLVIPAAAVSMNAARALADIAAAGGTARLETHAHTGPAETRTVIGELPGERSDTVVMLGAHLDSVVDGPGMNDDGSGVAALLEIARSLGGTRPHATIRLAFWAGEEEGLLGSAHYVEGLGGARLGEIVAYLNADMVGSPNGFVGVYDEQAAAPGSPAVRALLSAGLDRLGAMPVGLDIGGGSDHVPFRDAGVPTGGVVSGATERLTAGQAASFGGTAGVVADACYHQACDVIANVNLPLARLLVAGLADLAVRLATSPTLVSR